MEAFEILVIILSATLAILLVACIVFVVMLVKLINQLHQLTTKAEEIVDDVEAVSNFFKQAAGPVAITGLISNIVSTVTQHMKKNKGKK